MAAHDDDAGLTRLAISATLHCLTGCAIGEVLGMIIGTALGWSDLQTIALAVGLAFVFGYAMTVGPVMRSGLTLREAVPVALAADTASITVMEVVDNGVMLVVPGAMDSGLTAPLFWASLAFALLVAFVVTVPVNRWLLSRGRGHAVVHGLHGDGGAGQGHGEGHGEGHGDGHGDDLGDDRGESHRAGQGVGHDHHHDEPKRTGMP